MLHFLLEEAHRLVDVAISNNYLHASLSQRA
jgi:hypothetical protein